MAAVESQMLPLGTQAPAFTLPDPDGHEGADEATKAASSGDDTSTKTNDDSKSTDDSANRSSAGDVSRGSP